MRVAVYGLWHLGSVTAACLAAAGFETVGIDPDAATITNLAAGIPPLFEPGLEEAVRTGLASNRLGFTTDLAAVGDADIVWVTFDTPVDDEDRADDQVVISAVERLFPHLRDGTVVLVSSQLPVGSTRRLEVAFADAAAERRVSFAYSPENLRLGKAIEVFTRPERIIVGTRDEHARRILTPLLERFCQELIWISVESAEMAKHALNAFLATSVTFINEVALICEQVGADAAEVEAALRSEPRIGRRAYIRPGSAFAGGTLARDVMFLDAIGRSHGLTLPLLGGIIPSNRSHRHWPLAQLKTRLGDLAGRRVAVLGLTYKPGTDSLRRSLAIELCRQLIAAGAVVSVHDPAAEPLPPDLAGQVIRPASAEAALTAADAAVLATEWPVYRELDPAAMLAAMARPLLLDQGRFLADRLAADNRFQYVTVGTPL
jgi:UDPglucose 6-dehydrogenase